MVTTRKRSAPCSEEPAPKNISSSAPKQSATGQPPKASSSSSSNAQPSIKDRIDPKRRGIHPDAIQVGRAPSRAATCISCGHRIEKRSARWGIKYAGNPLPVPVIPLYGQNPMVLWCHPGGCGLTYVRYSDLPKDISAARTCHACQDAPDEQDPPLDSNNATTTHRSIRLLCGGPPNSNGKIRQHAFHISCWRKAITSSDHDLATELYVSPLIGSKTRKRKNEGEIMNAVASELSWTDLTGPEREQVHEEYQLPSSEK